MEINDTVVARLAEVGDQNSAMWKQVRMDIDEVIKTLARYYPGGGKISYLDGCMPFKHWPSGQYELSGQFSSQRHRVFLSRDNKPQESVLEFCHWVKSGWLERVTVELKKETENLSDASKAMKDFVQKATPASLSLNPLERYPWLAEKFDVQMSDLVIIDSISRMSHNLNRKDLRPLHVQYLINNQSTEGFKSFALATLKRLQLLDCEVLDRGGRMLGFIYENPAGARAKWEFRIEDARFVVFYTPRNRAVRGDEIFFYEIKQES